LIYKNHKFSVKKCKEYLKQYGLNRDICLRCCDTCPHLRYVSLSEDKFILNIATINAEEEFKNKIN